MTPTTPIADAISTMTAAISLRRVSQLFGSFVALRDVSLDLPMGGSVMLLGPNGAGKSTLLRLLAGLATPAYGEVRIWGEPPSHSRGQIAYMSHSTMLYDELTAQENLEYLLGLQRPELTLAQRTQHVAEGLKAVGLDPFNARRLGEYSQGMRQRASLARVLLAEPDLLLLDEPFSNLDVGSAHAMIERLQAYLSPERPQGRPRTLLFTTHQAALAQPLAKTTLVLQAGSLVSVKDLNALSSAGVAGEHPVLTA